MRAIILGVTLGLLAALGLGSVKAQDHNHPPEHAAIHEQFYNSWLRPEHRDDSGKRTASCCNKKDCRPSPFRPRADGDFDVLTLKGEWVRFPATLMEENQSDPRESPDGLSHACVNPESRQPLCGVRGSGQ